MEGEMLEHLSDKQLGSKIKSSNSATIPISNIPAHAWTADQLVQELTDEPKPRAYRSQT